VRAPYRAPTRALLEIHLWMTLALHPDFLRRSQAGLHRINLMTMWRGRDQLLFVSKLFAELLNRAARRLQKHFLGVGDDARLLPLARLPVFSSSRAREVHRRVMAAE